MAQNDSRSRLAGRKPRFAFTLIELLVVISVISLLIGLILPALAHSRTSARTGQCMSGLRQHGVAFNLYMLDYGALPHEDDANHPEVICWYFALNPYLGIKNDESSYGQIGVYPEIKVCPEVDQTQPAFIKSYRFNSRLESNDRPFLSIEWIRVTTSTPVLFDARYTGVNISYKGRQNKVHARHSGAANILFADWHVEPVRKSDVDSLRWKIK